MLLYAKPRRRQPAEVKASVNVKGALAPFALKVVVMSLVGAFVSRRFPGYFDGFDPARGYQCPNRAIDGRHAQAPNSLRRRSAQLVDAERPLRTLQDGAHRIPLLCLPHLDYLIMISYSHFLHKPPFDPGDAR